MTVTASKLAVGTHRQLLGFIAPLLLAFSLTACTDPERSIAGAPGIGDPYYPALGNGGYDVAHYRIELAVEPMANLISGTTFIESRATHALRSLNLDFEGLEVDSAVVNGRPADFSRDGRELTITPAESLQNGSEFTVAIAYHGSPGPTRSIASSYEHDLAGWFQGKDGASNVLASNVLAPPNGAATWFPVNDHPLDKATYHFEIAVPEPFVVVASGILVDTAEREGRILYVWDMDQPMASYLASINVGKYVLETGPPVDGVGIRSYFPPGFHDSKKQGYARIPEMIALFSELFGPYSFRAYGVVIADSTIEWCARFVTHALESQTLSIHCPDLLSGQEDKVVHELAHQWFGNSVSLKSWQDIWLKEGLATYASWLWLTRGGGEEVLAELVEQRRSMLTMEAPIGRSPADNLYNDAVYTGGALLFHALRLKVGEETFFELLRTYTRRYRYNNAGSADFIALAEEVSGDELGDFFEEWLYSPELPEAQAAS